MEPQESNMEQRLTNLSRQIHALDEKLNVILEFCLKQNTAAQELKSDISGLREEMKSMKMLSLMGKERAELGGVTASVGYTTFEPAIPIPKQTMAPTTQRRVCPECGAVDQMEQIKETIYDEEGRVLSADAPALECQICGEVVRL